MSFIKIFNKRSPRIEPCDTSAIKLSQSLEMTLIPEFRYRLVR